MDTPFSILSLKDFREDQRAFSNKLGENFKEWGFCGLKDHGIDTDLLNETQELFKEFFDLPDDFKKKFFKPSLHGARGYTPFKTETAKDSLIADLKEFWHVGRELSQDDPYLSLIHI